MSQDRASEGGCIGESRLIMPCDGVGAVIVEKL